MKLMEATDLSPRRNLMLLLRPIAIVQMSAAAITLGLSFSPSAPQGKQSPPC